jgi:hypothetical protein
MCIAKLKDGPKRVKKTFSMIWKRFLKDMMEGRKWNHIKKNFFEEEVFFSFQNINFPFYLKRLLELSFFQYFFFLFFSFFLSSISWGLGGFDDIRGEKILFQQLLFKWNGVGWLSVDISGGRIFWNGVMHANMAKPWSWRWGSCGYISGGCIFWSGHMHADIFNSQIIFEKYSKLSWTLPLIKLNTNKSSYVDNI